ncbi:hypothetical protein DMC63_01250 [Streptomyces sp. WAC 05977]|nr:hypothetical protein DMC63_01250 [Streptomyces sp. WAC 05977]
MAEIFVNDTWTDITSDIRLSDQITVSYGSSSVTRSPTPQPASCTFTVNNRSGDYSPRNPLGAYYGSLGQNTPLRVASRVATDSFTRSTANGWGTGTTGQAWTTPGTAARYATTGSAGTLSFTAAGQSLLAYQAAQLFRDVEVAASFTFPFSNVTGGSVGFGVVLDGVAVDDYFVARLTISAAEVPSLDIINVTSGGDVVIVAAAEPDDFTFTGQQLRIKAQMSGQTLRAKVWPATGDEPFDWLIEGTTTEGLANGITYADRGKGWAGVYGVSGAGNTNATYALSVDDFEVRINQFHGEATSWPTMWDVSGNDIYGRVEAAGLRRRLSQGAATLPSTYTRGNINTTPAHLLYYPIEDGSEAVAIASGLPNTDPMTIDMSSGSSQLASNSDFSPGSAPIGKPNGSRWYSPRVSATATGEAQLVFLVSIPDSGDTDTATIVRIHFEGGTIWFVDIAYRTSGNGSIYFVFYNRLGVAIHTSALLAGGFTGRPVQLSVQLVQNGANIDYTLAQLEPGQTSGGFNGGTVASQTFSAPSQLIVNPYLQLVGTAVGHMALRNDIISIFANADELKAYNGEGVRQRLIRLCAENDDIPFERDRSTLDVQAFMGKQKQLTLLQLLDEAVHTDLGMLLESRDVIGLKHIMLRRLYNRDAFLTLDYAAGQVQPPFGPVDDDQLIINDFVATRVDGSSYRATQETGPLALTSPTSGEGVGRYADSDSYSLSNDSTLADIASWVVHAGTTDESRYPSVVANVSKLALASRQLYLDLLGVWVGDRIEITDAKPEIIEGTVSQIVYGYRRRFGGKLHEIDFTCGPAQPFAVAEAADTTGDTNPWLARADTDGSTVNTLASAGATSLSVATTSGPLWTTAADDFPLYLDVGGIQVRATACSGTSSPQTITVDALPVARAAGLPVSVWHLPVIAL